MSDQQLLAQIVCDPKVMVGKPVIKGTRLTVEFILNILCTDRLWMKSSMNTRG